MNKSLRTPETRLLVALQILCASSAIASLPAGMIHPAWIAAFIIPSVLFLGLGASPIRTFVPAWVRLTLAAITQGLAVWAAFLHFGPLDEKSSLACSLLPALTYFTLRKSPSDTSLSLFLSFCFLLIGIILNHDSANWALLLFLVGCPWAMQIESSNRTLLLKHSTQGSPMSWASRALRRTQVIIALSFAILFSYLAIDLIPSPAGQPNNTNSGSIARFHSSHNVGLSNRFDLSGSQGSPVNITASAILNVKDPYGGRTPRNLYLRMAFFDQAGIQEWKTWPFNSIRREQPLNQPFWCQEAIQRGKSARKHLIIRRLAPAPSGALYLPPGTIGIQGVRYLEFNNTVAHYRSAGPVEDSYRVSYQQMRKYARRASPRRGTELLKRLDDLPRSLQTPEIVDLAIQFGGSQPQTLAAIPLAERISNALQKRCKYELKDPEGPYSDPIHNFLFGSRRGYCMHFATSLAIMLRIHGIPCRIGVGFQGGSPNKDNSRTFGSQHAHAWVELPLVNFGWVVVDPTPSANLSQPGWPDSSASPAVATGNKLESQSTGISWALNSLSPLFSQPWNTLRNPLQHPGPFLFLLGIFSALALCVVALVKRSLAHRGRLRGSGKPSPDTLQARALLDSILMALSRNGYPKNHRITLEEFLDLLSSQQTNLDLPVLRLAFDSYQQVRFGHKNLDTERHNHLISGLSTAKHPPPESK
jgi:hypothetical protein